MQKGAAPPVNPPPERLTKVCYNVKLLNLRVKSIIGKVSSKRRKTTIAADRQYRSLFTSDITCVSTTPSKHQTKRQTLKYNLTSTKSVLPDSM